MFQAEEATTVKALRWKHSSMFHEQQAARGPEQNEQGEAARPRSINQITGSQTSASSKGWCGAEDQKLKYLASVSARKDFRALHNRIPFEQ